MRKKTGIVLFLWLFFMSTPSVLAQEFRPLNSPDEFAVQLKELAAEIQTIQCDFTQVKHMSVMKDEVKSHGKFYYALEGEKICLAFDDPAGDLIAMGNGKFRIITGGKENTVGMQSNPALKQLKTMLSACMTGDVAVLETGSRIEYLETEREYRVVMTPDNKRARKYISRIVLDFDKRDMSLNQLRMEESSGDFTHYEFTGKAFNRPVDSAQFGL